MSCPQRTKMLISAGIRVLVVFDGGALPAKANEADERRRVRQENRDRAREVCAAFLAHPLAAERALPATTVWHASPAPLRCS